jgi:hypothetical protein
MSPIRIVLLFVAVLILLSLLLPATRSRDRAQAVQPPGLPHNYSATEARLLSALASVSASELPSKGNAKLESSLAQLVDAFEREGVVKAASVAEEAGMRISGDSVRIIIEAQPGKT